MSVTQEVGKKIILSTISTKKVDTIEREVQYKLTSSKGTAISTENGRKSALNK